MLFFLRIIVFLIYLIQASFIYFCILKKFRIFLWYIPLSIFEFYKDESINQIFLVINSSVAYSGKLANLDNVEF
jgi:hypothetical protein